MFIKGSFFVWKILLVENCLKDLCFFSQEDVYSGGDTGTMMRNEDMGTMILNHDDDAQDGTMIINSGTMLMNDGTMIENNLGTMVINDSADESTMKSKGILGNIFSSDQ